MSNKHLEHLIPAFKEKLEQLMWNCLERKVEMRPYAGVRSPLAQARYWRQSRSEEEVYNKIRELEEQGAPFLASCIERAGPQEGRKVTNAIPGLSWHQWGEAADLFWQVDNKAIWDTELLIADVNGYQVYAEEAKRLQLDAGMYWKGFPDPVHVQLRAVNSPLDIYTIQYIDEFMMSCFSGSLTR
jgi:peptidoglycan LD-endopeptidase CwlK